MDVCGSKSVFAALLSDGKVVTWGEGRACDTSDVQETRKGCKWSEPVGGPRKDHSGQIEIGFTI